MFKSLKSKLIIFTLLISITPLMVNSIFEKLMFKRTQVSETKLYQTNTVKMNAKIIDTWLDDRVLILDSLSTTNLDKVENINDTKILDIFQTMKNVKNKYNIKMFSYIDTKGTLMNDQGVQILVSDQEHFKATMASKTIYISDIFIDKIDGGKIFVADKPILDADKNIKYIIQIVIDAKYITDFINDIKIGKNGHAYLVNKDGVFLSHFDESLLGRSYKEINPTSWDTVKSSIFKNSTGNLEYKDNLKKEEKFAAYETIDCTGWKLITEVNTSELYETINNSIRISIIIISITCILVIFLALLFALTISKPITQVTAFLNKVSQFDLTDNINYKGLLNRKDELGIMFKSLIKMQNTLRDLTNMIKEHSSSVESNSKNLSIIIKESTSSIEDVAKASEELANGSNELAKNTQDSVSELTLLSDEITNVVSSSALVKEYIAETNKVTKVGLNNINYLSDAIKTNIEVTDKVSNQIDILNEKSQSITKITDTIKSITRQINLLSLNAAIEAARAGESGKGFSVVASEIRKLATETSTATKEIDSIIKSVKTEVTNSKIQMNNVKSALNNTILSSKDTKEAFDSIEKTILNILNRADALIDNINKMSNNKDKTLENMENLSALSQQSASSTEEISASVQQQLSGMDNIFQATEELNKIASELKNLISAFKS